ncbi:class I SAM-dependent methyltransferase [Paenibacillus thalictri]|uniref:class I SAM-dependent methyltransferase n=1 Tax=Paenibacillus thalictri TaxID=2527873 RepID=UPI001F0E5E49|nr:class I SAM-dependent methyltransferase [Paenibacillus thalictri]
MDERIAKIRSEEKAYHEACYERHGLFETGSWLHKPVKTVMDELSCLDPVRPLYVLDLGCGVGRNSIPIAQKLRDQDVTVDCVDVLESALNKLRSYSEQFGVAGCINTYPSDIGDYVITEGKYDFIVAVSALEHLESMPKLKQVLDKMHQGTKPGGINCIVMNTDIQEIDLDSGEELAPQIELILTLDEAEMLLSNVFADWSIRPRKVQPLTFHIERQGKPVLLKSNCITFVAQRITC